MSQNESHDVDVAASAPVGYSAGAAFLAGDILSRAWAKGSAAPMMAAAKKKTTKKPMKKAPGKKKPTRPKPTKGPGCVTDGPKCKSSTGTC
jgi:hypothetical protein